VTCPSCQQQNPPEANFCLGAERAWLSLVSKLLDSVVERMMEAVHCYEGCCDQGRDRWAMSPPYQQWKHGTPSLGAPFSPYDGQHRGD